MLIRTEEVLAILRKPNGRHRPGIPAQLRPALNLQTLPTPHNNIRLGTQRPSHHQLPIRTHPQRHNIIGVSLHRLDIASPHKLLLEGVHVHRDADGGRAVQQGVRLVAPEDVLSGVLDFEAVDELKGEGFAGGASVDRGFWG